MYATGRNSSTPPSITSTDLVPAVTLFVGVVVGDGQTTAVVDQHQPRPLRAEVSRLVPLVVVGLERPGRTVDAAAWAAHRVRAVLVVVAVRDGITADRTGDPSSVVHSIPL